MLRHLFWYARQAVFTILSIFTFADCFLLLLIHRFPSVPFVRSLNDSIIFVWFYPLSLKSVDNSSRWQRSLLQTRHCSGLFSISATVRLIDVVSSTSHFYVFHIFILVSFYRFFKHSSRLRHFCHSSVFTSRWDRMI